jgi:hypothetical protein
MVQREREGGVAGGGVGGDGDDALGRTVDGLQQLGVSAGPEADGVVETGSEYTGVGGRGETDRRDRAGVADKGPHSNGCGDMMDVNIVFAALQEELGIRREGGSSRNDGTGREAQREWNDRHCWTGITTDQERAGKGRLAG